jgi:hypothetical protein
VSKKLRKFLLAEVERMYIEVEAQDLPYDDAFKGDAHYELFEQRQSQDYRAIEVFEDILWVAFSLPKPYRNVMLRRIAVLFEDSPNYKEKWRP